MKLSFVIPAYNEEAYIGKCLESIVKQSTNSQTEIEIIVVNNASTDATAEVARSFPNVRVIDEEKKGLVFAREAGYMASSGDIIANVDADSILTEGWIDTVVCSFTNNKKLVALSGPYIYYDLSKWTSLWVRLFYYLAYISYIINRFILKNGSLVQGGNMVIQRNALNAVGGFNTNFTFYGEDSEIARMLQPIGHVVFTFRLPMYTSGRRIKKGGLVTMGCKYAINHFWTIFFHKPFTNKYLDVREDSTL